ncbi:MAG: 4Fe-4S binding protein [Candidatus Bathyarchaeia archaeon]
MSVDYERLPLGTNIYGIILAPQKTGVWRALRPVMDRDLCTQCGICWTYCPDHIIRKMEDGSYEIDYDFCKGCGVCAEECPSRAIEMVMEGS